MSIYREFMSQNYNQDTGICEFINFTVLPQDRGVSLEDIPKFTKANTRFSVNVYAHDSEEETVYPIMITAEEKEYHMDLMLLIDKSSGSAHYIYIYDLDLLLLKKNCKKTFRCRSCLNGFASRDEKDLHTKICTKYPAQRLVFPSHQFVNYDLGANEIRHTFWVSADFETYMKVKLYVHCKYL
jgi:hypothetical protein